jgi:PAS domain S-box-containing protein
MEDLSRFFDNSLGMLCVASYDGYLTRLNPAWQKTLGWTLKHLQSRPYIEFVHPDDRAATLSEASHLVSGGRTIQFENRYRSKDGTYRWLQWTANSLPARRQIYAIAYDVTERMRLRKEILDAADREKERLGRELHDGLCQNLAAIAALNAALARKLGQSREACAADVAQIGAQLRLSIRSARDLARGLSPDDLPLTGIAVALTTYAANVEALYGVACRFQGAQFIQRLAPGAEAHLFRIAQQAVDNAIKHGRARRIEIGLSARDGQGRLTIHDNGAGFAKKPASGNGGIGLHIMNYRAQLIGGMLQVRRLVRGGADVTCSFPLKPDTSTDRRRRARQTA